MKIAQEQTDLLLKDLCSRLPYGIKVEVNYGDAKYAPSTPSKIDVANKKLIFNFDIPIQYCKLYLRSIESITEEEANEFGTLTSKLLEEAENTEIWDSVVDWLNAHHFDHRGLIPQELAIEAPEGMYNLNKE